MRKGDRQLNETQNKWTEQQAMCPQYTNNEVAMEFSGNED